MQLSFFFACLNVLSSYTLHKYFKKKMYYSRGVHKIVGLLAGLETYCSKKGAMDPIGASFPAI